MKVPIPAQDLSEPIIRPSIKVAIDNCVNGKFNAHNREKALTVRIYYFASDRYKFKIENAKMQEIIENAFLDGLIIEEGFYIPIEQVESDITDTVLICSFDLNIIELLPEQTGEPMENIEIKGGINL